MKEVPTLHFPCADFKTARCGAAFVRFEGSEAEFDKAKDCEKCLRVIREKANR